MIKTLTRKPSWFQKWMRYHFFEKKLQSGLGVAVMTIVAVIVSYSTAVIDVKIGPAIAIFFAGLLLVIACIKYPYFSFYFTFVLSAFLYALNRFLNLQMNVPYGVLVEIFTYITILGILLRPDLREEINRKFWFNPISICLLVLFAYYFVEFFNPEMLSREGYFNFIRKQFSYFFLYYACYCLLNSKARIIQFTYFFVILSGVLGFYACKQQWFGYADFEMRTIMNNPVTYQLLFQGGFLRKFSTMADPGTSGVFFASCAMQAIILALRGKSKKQRRILYAVIFADIMGYSFSGTRTATLMIVAGILFYALTTIYEKKTFLFLAACIGCFTALMVMPYQNVFTNRIKTTFEGTKDPSAAIRDVDRAAVQPYLHEHPLGGGIFTCGDEGAKYNQGHFLATLQPDSGYMKAFAEQGPIGLGLLLVFYFIIMRQGIQLFYHARDPEIRTQAIALLTMMFTLLVSQYSQMAVAQYPVSMYYFGSLVVFLRLSEFDKPETTTNTQKLQT